MEKIDYLCSSLGKYPLTRKYLKTHTIMRRLFTIMTIAVVALFASCENADEATSTKHLNITSGNTYNVDAEGGDVYVTYSLNNPVDGGSVGASLVSCYEAIEDIKTPTTGVIIITVNANTTTAKRTIVVDVNYGESNNGICRVLESTSIVINQAANGSNNGGNDEGGNNGGNENDNNDVVTFEAAKFNGNYYGQQYSEGADGFTIFLSEQGLNNAGQAFPNSVYYYVYAFAPVATGGAPYTIPNGTYKWDTTNSNDPYTINSESTQVIYTTDIDTNNIVATNAKMIVEDNKITLEMTISGKLHKVTYSGAMVLTDLTGNDDGGNDDGGSDDPTGGQENESKSTLTDDVVFTFPNTPRVTWTYEGDWWQTGYSNYTIMIMDKSGDYTTACLQLDIITDNTSNNGDIDGTYTFAYTANKNVAMSGFIDNWKRPVGSWYFEYGSGSGMAGYKNYAMLISGSVDITNNGDGTHTIKVDAYDCNNNNITCNWSGEVVKK